MLAVFYSTKMHVWHQGTPYPLYMEAQWEIQGVLHLVVFLSMLPNPLSEIGEEHDKRQSKSDNVISVLPKEFMHWYKITEKQSLNNQVTALDNQCLNP